MLVRTLVLQRIAQEYEAIPTHTTYFATITAAAVTNTTTTILIALGYEPLSSSAMDDAVTVATTKR